MAASHLWDESKTLQGSERTLEMEVGGRGQKSQALTGPWYVTWLCSGGASMAGPSGCGIPELVGASTRKPCLGGKGDSRRGDPSLVEYVSPHWN